MVRSLRKIRSNIGKNISNVKGKLRLFNPELKAIIFELIKKISNTTKGIIIENSQQEGDLFYNFNILKNKDKLTLAAFLLNKSYRISKGQNLNETPPQIKSGGNKSNKFSHQNLFAEFSNSIYLNEKKFKEFISKIGGNIHIYSSKQQFSNKLIPKYSIITHNDTKSIIVSIKGTSTFVDAVIDGLATVESVQLDGKTYFAHSGFLRSGKEIVKQIKDKIIELTNLFKGYNIVVTGHSLGGGVSTTTGVLLYNEIKDIIINNNIKLNIWGYASGTSFAAEPNGNVPLKKYLNKHTNLNIKTFVYKEDVVPRLSVYDGFIFIAICTAISKLIFLNENIDIFDNFHLNREVVNGMYKELHINKLQYAAKMSRTIKNTPIKMGKRSSKFGKFLNTKKKRFIRGGATKPNTMIVLKKIKPIVDICISYFENKFKNDGKYYQLKTTHPGNLYMLTDSKSIKKINTYDLSYLKFQLNSVKNHSMVNYIQALNNNIINGGRKTRKRRKRRKKRSKYSRRK